MTTERLGVSAHRLTDRLPIWERLEPRIQYAPFVVMGPAVMVSPVIIVAKTVVRVTQGACLLNRQVAQTVPVKRLLAT